MPESGLSLISSDDMRSGAAAPVLPAAWIAAVESRLSQEEKVTAWLETDLNPQLHFDPGLVVVTNKCLRVKAGESATWQEWNYRPGLTLVRSDHAGVGSLEFFDENSLLARWRYTLGRDAAVSRLIDNFRAQLHYHLSGELRPLPIQILCPKCHRILDAPLAPEQEECDTCRREVHAPPSTWTLLRLWRFAKPYKWKLLVGFLLTLGSTGAAMVPPYLTMPLMDNVLIPYQNGKPIDVELVVFYLTGLLAAAIVAWGLGWARTYVLALVSERIGADLRTATFEHLLKLSHAYFGGKRTGDLMARIGSETDRLNIFLSLHLLDFATDVLMIGMMTIILVSIEPWLALVTLTPLPIIAWLIHLVRDKLRTGFEKVDRVWAELTSVLADTIPGVRVVKAFAQEKR